MSGFGTLAVDSSSIGAFSAGSDVLSSVAPAAGAATAEGAAASILGGASPFGWVMAGSQILGGLMGGSKAPAGPSAANGNSQYAPQTFDDSNWTVSTGSSSAKASSSSGSGAGGGSLGGTLAGVSMPWIAGAIILGVILWKRL